MKKGQIAVTDFFIAFTIITILIVSIALFWGVYNKRIEEKISYTNMQMRVLQITDLLIKSSGTPSGWELNPQSVILLGLATKDRNISISKVNAFVNLDDDIIKDLLKIKSYNFYFEIKGVAITKGSKPLKGKRAISLEDNVIYENQDRVLNFILWEK